MISFSFLQQLRLEEIVQKNVDLGDQNEKYKRDLENEISTMEKSYVSIRIQGWRNICDKNW